MTQPSDTPIARSALIAVVALLALVGGVLAASFFLHPGAGGAGAPEELRATYLPGGKPLNDFTLVDHNGEVFNEARLSGQWTFLFLGYTYCPDVCPTTLMTLAQAYSRIESELPDVPVQVVFISVDPQRDTPARLADYVSFFNPDFLGVTGTDPELRGLTRDLGMIYDRHDPEPGKTDYLVDHSASVLLTNPQGQLQAVFSPPQDADAMARDFRKIVQFHSAQ